MKTEFTHDEKIERSFRRVAGIVHGVWLEGGTVDPRLLDLLVPDEYVVLGQSKRGGNCREHLIPPRVLLDSVSAMFNAGATVLQATEFLRRSLKIVWVHRDETYALSELGLNDSMPPGWVPGHADSFSRMSAAGIDLIDPIPETRGLQVSCVEAKNWPLPDGFERIQSITLLASVKPYTIAEFETIKLACMNAEYINEKWSVYYAEPWLHIWRPVAVSGSWAMALRVDADDKTATISEALVACWIVAQAWDQALLTEIALWLVDLLAERDVAFPF